jgi:glucosamine--fructose-6-phosphate aminotransferase (isomerizing)
MYTSSGRDIEMSVASTKAFYSQIVAGALLGLYIARLKNTRTHEFIAEQINHLIKLPDQMKTIIAMSKQIQASAQKIAPGKTYWAAVGSGMNKASADEIRIKLSELCYKTISSDYVEDKKHIDLSSEPMIIVCAAGTRDTVIKDIIKDVAIFQAHKATPLVIADKGEHRFDPYAADVFHVPLVQEHLAPVLSTLVGHLWGYYAALAINDGSRFLYKFREHMEDTINEHLKKGIDIFELTLEKSFREKIIRFYKEFRQKEGQSRLSAMGLKTGLDITLLLKYLSGSLPVLEFEADFGKKGTPANILDTFFQRMGDAINSMSRPVDAIKHQAKTVTVGTSRISEKVQGILFDLLADYNFGISQITAKNIIVLKNIQNIISQVKGSFLYRVHGLDLLGYPGEQATIKLLRKQGILEELHSRVETDIRLKGTKRIIVIEKNVYIGMGEDGRSIVIIPILSHGSDGPSHIEHLLLLNISFKNNIQLPVKIKALGKKYEKIKDFVRETMEWDDDYLQLIETKELFGIKAADIAKKFLSLCQKGKAGMSNNQADY